MKQKPFEFLKTGANFTIRNMKKEERKQVRKLVWHCFPVTEAWPFRFTPHVLVVEHEKKIRLKYILENESGIWINLSG